MKTIIVFYLKIFSFFFVFFFFLFFVFGEFWVYLNRRVFVMYSKIRQRFRATMQARYNSCYDHKICQRRKRLEIQNNSKPVNSKLFLLKPIHEK